MFSSMKMNVVLSIIFVVFVVILFMSNPNVVDILYLLIGVHSLIKCKNKFDT